MSPRRSLRIPLPVETVRAEDGRSRFLGYLENVSATGIFVQCSVPRAEGTRLALRLRLPGAEVLERVAAEVVWTRGYRGRNGPAPGMGLRLVDPDTQILTEIRRFCEESDARIHPVIGAGPGKLSPG